MERDSGLIAVKISFAIFPKKYGHMNMLLWSLWEPWKGPRKGGALRLKFLLLPSKYTLAVILQLIDGVSCFPIAHEIMGV